MRLLPAIYTFCWRRLQCYYARSLFCDYTQRLSVVGVALMKICFKNTRAVLTERQVRLAAWDMV